MNRRCEPVAPPGASRFPRNAVLSRSSAVAAALCLAAAFVSAEEQPKNPFAPRDKTRKDAKLGAMTLSDGKVLKGMVYLTRDKPIEIFEDKKNQWHEIKIKDMARFENKVEEEKVEKEWRWKEGGSDIKVYTGRTYVDRKYATTLSMTDGKAIEGHIKGTVLYLANEEGTYKYFIRQDQRGDYDVKPADLIYIKTIVFEEPKETTAPDKKTPPEKPESKTGGQPEGKTGGQPESKTGDKPEEKTGEKPAEKTR